MSTELNPCPFCGGAAKYERECDDRGNAAIECQGCGASVGANDLVAGIERWNRRASSPAAVPEGALPPLPEPQRYEPFGRTPTTYSADQIQAYARAAVEADRARQNLSGRDSALRAEPAGQHDAGIAVLAALRDGIPLQEPVNITKAVLAQREARVVLSGGKGPVACVMLVNIQLTGWADGPEKAEAWASGYNTAFKWYRGALIDLASKVSADAATRCRAEGGDGAVTDYGSLVDNSADRAQQGEPVDVCAQMRALCSACGGTGDIHRPDGEYMGECDCAATKAAGAAALSDFAQKLGASQVPLDPEFARIYHENAWDLYATDDAAPAPDTGIPTAGEVPSTINPMCERKTNHIIERDGYAKSGYVLRKAGADICVSDGGAVAWFTPDQWNWLMFNRMHTTFDWPLPLGHKVAPVSSTPTSGAVDAATVYREALEHAAFYVRDHLQHGDEHVEIIANLKMPSNYEVAAPSNPSGAKAGEPGPWQVLEMKDQPEPGRLLDVVLTNGVMEEGREHSAIDWTQVADWRYSRAKAGEDA